MGRENVRSGKSANNVEKKYVVRELVRTIDCRYDKHYNKCYVLRVEEELKGSHGNAIISL